MGRIIPSGTGMARYRTREIALEVAGEEAVEDELPPTGAEAEPLDEVVAEA